MKSAQVLICNRLGLHARAAAKLVQLASQFASRITLDKAGEAADAKSIMEVLMLAAAKDSTLTVTVEGQDEDVALEEVQRLIANRFGEED
ncbi:MAG TPA: HPr family phosphocarrier protein [bacterium]|nr:HPr family phosphocarrier protein [bacterium]